MEKSDHIVSAVESNNSTDEKLTQLPTEFSCQLSYRSSCDSVVQQHIRDLFHFYMKHNYVVLNDKIIISRVPEIGHCLKVKQGCTVNKDEILIKINGDGMVGQQIVNFLMKDEKIRCNKNYISIMQDKSIQDTIKFALCIMMYSRLDQNLYKNDILYQKMMLLIGVIKHNNTIDKVNRWKKLCDVDETNTSCNEDIRISLDQPQVSVKTNPMIRYIARKILDENNLGTMLMYKIDHGEDLEIKDSEKGEKKEKWDRIYDEFCIFINYVKSHRWHVMLPLIDLVNHSTDSNSKLVTNNLTESIHGGNVADNSIYSTKDIGSEEFVSINYGVIHDDMRMMLNYDFVESYHQGTISSLFFGITADREEYEAIRPMIEGNKHFFDDLTQGQKRSNEQNHDQKKQHNHEIFFPIHLNRYDLEEAKISWNDPMGFFGDIMMLAPLLKCDQCNKMCRMINSIASYQKEFRKIVLLNYRNIMSIVNVDILHKLEDEKNSYIGTAIKNQILCTNQFIRHNIEKHIAQEKSSSPEENEDEKLTHQNVKVLIGLINSEFIRKCPKHQYHIYIGHYKIPVMNLLKTTGL